MSKGHRDQHLVSSISNFIFKDEDIKAVPSKFVGLKLDGSPDIQDDRIRTHDLNWTEPVERNKMKSNKDKHKHLHWIQVVNDLS